MSDLVRQVDPETGEVAELVPNVLSFGDIERMLLDPSLNTEVDPTEVQRQEMQRILMATDEDDVFSRTHVFHARDYVDKPFTLHAAQMLPSDIESDGLQIYAAMQCTDEDGKEIVITCGAAKVVAQVFWAITRNILPQVFVIREKERATKRGYKPMWLEKSDTW